LHLEPWKELRACNVVQGADRDEDGRNPARRRPDLAGKGRGSDEGSPRVRFLGSNGAEEALDRPVAASWLVASAAVLFR
jgi:hypothetical protein